MAMTSMKRNKTKDSTAKLAVEAVPSGSDSYPWGLSITMEKESLDKLGKSARDFELGGEFTATVKFKTSSITENNESNSVGLQITAMDLGSTGKMARQRERLKSGPGVKA